jgi:hypothetical protein
MATVTNSINNTIGASNSGATNTLTVTNSSNTASSQAQVLISVGGSSAGDPYIHWNINGVIDWVMGIDNSDSDRLVISRSATPGTTNVAYFDSTGIVFPSSMGATFNTSVGGTGTSATSNQMTIYEEGTWTPTVQSSNGNMTTISYTTQTGFYRIIGNKIWLSGLVTWSAAGAGTGRMLVNNIPFTVLNSHNIICPLVTESFTWSAVTATLSNHIGTYESNTTRLSSNQMGSNAASATNNSQTGGSWAFAYYYGK